MACNHGINVIADGCPERSKEDGHNSNNKRLAVNITKPGVIFTTPGSILTAKEPNVNRILYITEKVSVIFRKDVNVRAGLNRHMDTYI
jgi:hypothetical protein